MVNPRNAKRSEPEEPTHVRAPSLKEALTEVKKRFGPDVRVLESRTVMVAQQNDLGREKMVEVVVVPSASPLLAPRAAAEGSPLPGAGSGLAADLAGEVERIESLIRNLARDRSHRRHVLADCRDYPLAETLLAAGASQETVRRMANVFSLATPGEEKTLPAARDHLRSWLRTSQGGWGKLGGCHLFLGDSGAGKSDLVLGCAATLQEQGRKVLVLSLLPPHGGEIRRLQLEAAQYGYDAAVLKQPEQLQGSETHFAGYDAVLMDTPSLFASEFLEAGDLQSYLSQNESFHRHVVLPLDVDLRDCTEVWETVRLWNCDWIALSRMDRTRRPGKILDVLGRLALPLSLCSSGRWPEAGPQIASAETLTDLMLGEEEGLSVATARA